MLKSLLIFLNAPITSFFQCKTWYNFFLWRLQIVLKQKSGKKWELHQEIRHVLHNKEEIIIYRGFPTDLSSVPKFLWGVLPPYGDFLLASLVHDYLYTKNKSRGRKFADKEMYVAAPPIILSVLPKGVSIASKATVPMIKSLLIKS